jgi:hypothetical protein
MYVCRSVTDRHAAGLTLPGYLCVAITLSSPSDGKMLRAAPEPLLAAGKQPLREMRP